MADDDPAAPAPDKAGPSEDTGKRLDEISERLNQALEKIGSLSTPPPIAVPAQQQPALWSAGFWMSAGLFVVSIACIVVGLMLQEMRGANWILLALVGALVAVGSLTMVSPPAWQGLLEFTKTGLFFMLAGSAFSSSPSPTWKRSTVR
jgi:hypothetical protein